MRRQHVGWALVFVVFTLVPAAWWLLNVYAPPPRALAFPEDASEPPLKSLNYEWVGSSAMEPYDTGMLRLRNTDKVTWTQIDVEIGVFAQPSNARFEFKCPTPSTVPPGQVLIVPFQYRGCGSDDTTHPGARGVCHRCGIRTGNFLCAIRFEVRNLRVVIWPP
jgi:hypothetical protein